MCDDLAGVAPLNADHSQIGEHRATAARREIPGHGGSKDTLGEIRAAEFYVACAALLGQPRAVEAQPSPVVNRAAQLAHSLSRVKCPLAGAEVTKPCECLGLHSSDPVLCGEAVVTTAGKARSYL
jgi:hypothetical protein